jgi:hypothetical protein
VCGICAQRTSRNSPNHSPSSDAKTDSRVRKTHQAYKRGNHHLQTHIPAQNGCESFRGAAIGDANGRACHTFRRRVCCQHRLPSDAGEPLPAPGPIDRPSCCCSCPVSVRRVLERLRRVPERDSDAPPQGDRTTSDGFGTPAVSTPIRVGVSGTPCVSPYTSASFSRRTGSLDRVRILAWGGRDCFG